MDAEPSSRHHEGVTSGFEIRMQIQVADKGCKTGMHASNLGCRIRMQNLDAKLGCMFALQYQDGDLGYIFKRSIGKSKTMLQYQDVKLKPKPTPG